MSVRGEQPAEDEQEPGWEPLGSLRPGAPGERAPGGGKGGVPTVPSPTPQPGRDPSSWKVGDLTDDAEPGAEPGVEPDPESDPGSEPKSEPEPGPESGRPPA